MSGAGAEETTMSDHRPDPTLPSPPPERREHDAGAARHESAADASRETWHRRFSSRHDADWLDGDLPAARIWTA